ncbi:hypothetical protein V2I01_39345 [Micromonospora sp. BRA006-A]|nr:hypothetical protein [Micromonospora sp. BRA006-A]
MRPGAGIALGALGVLAFSMSLPATRVAVHTGPLVRGVRAGRRRGAARVAYLRLTGAPRPPLDQWRRLSIVALGVVVGFPCSPRWRSPRRRPRTAPWSSPCCPP